MSQPDPSRHERLTDLFLAASDLPAAEQPAFVRDRAGGDEELAREVLAMLNADLDPTTALAGAAHDLDLAAFTDAGTPGAAPERIGAYEVLRAIGEGGMGIVYEARQHKPDRVVALKVLRRAEDPDSLRRFEHEAEVLGWLQHPAIAHVYEAGVAPGAVGGERPYFAMELVEGAPIDVHCNEAGLDVEGRLRLLLRVADGVRHAHQKGVVHRDLKPANILVQPDGQPKVLDFGIARVASLEADGATALTRDGDVVGTLAYMSPEQVRADPAEIDTRVDVYALGVLAYELISAQRPIETGGVALTEAMRRVLQEDPRPLRDLVSDLPEDVATVVHKALAKDKGRRYASVEAFADDVQRFLDREPILARPASTVYKVTRFVQRHRAATLAAAAVTIALIAGVTASTILYLREQRALGLERSANRQLGAAKGELQAALDVAESRLETVRATNRHFERLLAAPLPGIDGAQVKMIDILRKASAEAQSAFADNPEQRAWLASTIGRSYSGIGLNEDALARALEAREAHREIPGIEPGVQADNARLAAQCLVELRRFDEAEAEIESALGHLGGLEDSGSHALRGDVYYVRALMYFDRGMPEPGLEAIQLCTAEYKKCEPVSPQEVARANSLRAEILWSQGEMESALELTVANLDELTATGSGDTIQAHLMRNNLGAIYYNSGQADKALPLMQAAFEGTRRLVGDEHEFIAKQASNLATVMRQRGRQEESLELYGDAVDIARRLYGSGHPTLAQNLSLRGSLLLGLERWDEGEADLREAIESMAGDDPSVRMARAMAKGYLSPALRKKDDFEGAERLLREAIEEKRDVLGTDVHPALLYEMRELAVNAEAQGLDRETFDRTLDALVMVLNFEKLGSPATTGLRRRAEAAIERMGAANAAPADIEDCTRRLRDALGSRD